MINDPVASIQTFSTESGVRLGILHYDRYPLAPTTRENIRVVLFLPYIYHLSFHPMNIDPLYRPSATARFTATPTAPPLASIASNEVTATTIEEESETSAEGDQCSKDTRVSFPPTVNCSVEIDDSTTLAA